MIYTKIENTKNPCLNFLSAEYDFYNESFNIPFFPSCVIDATNLGNYKIARYLLETKSGISFFVSHCNLIALFSVCSQLTKWCFIQIRNESFIHTNKNMQ